MNSKNTITAKTQIAAIAIIKLASDMKSIFSIVNAVNFSNQIYDDTKAINAEINQIADDAEKGRLNLIRLTKISEDINKLENLIIRKKALNPLISDELVKLTKAVATDANQAVVLTIIALK